MNMNDYFKQAMEILPSGAFLTTKNGDKVNTMTIGWGNFGFVWGMPIFEALVRESRFSKVLMDNNSEFTVTFPFGTDLKDALSFCGTKSGRDFDKIKDCDLPLAPAHKISTPVISCHGIVIECKVVASLDIDKDALSDEVLDKWYKTGDFHTIYYAKVEDAYEI